MDNVTKGDIITSKVKPLILFLKLFSNLFIVFHSNLLGSKEQIIELDPLIFINLNEYQLTLEVFLEEEKKSSLK